MNPFREETNSHSDQPAPTINPYESPRAVCQAVVEQSPEQIRFMLEKFRAQTSSLAGYWLVAGLFLSIIIFLIGPFLLFTVDWLISPGSILLTVMAWIMFLISIPGIVWMRTAIFACSMRAVRIGMVILCLLLVLDVLLVYGNGWPVLLFGLFLLPMILRSYNVLHAAAKIEACGISLQTRPSAIGKK